MKWEQEIIKQAQEQFKDCINKIEITDDISDGYLINVCMKNSYLIEALKGNSFSQFINDKFMSTGINPKIYIEYMEE